jgi:hypothetical protein
MLDITSLHAGSSAKVGADDLLGSGKDFVECHRGGVEDNGVGRGLEGGFGPVAVAVVAFFEFTDNGFFGETLLLGGERIGHLAGRLSGVSDGLGRGLTEPAIAANLGGSIKKDFDFGVREDSGADVAAFHDDAAGFAESALLLDHPGAEVGVDGDF